MKFPSIDELANQAKSAFLRFPFAIIMSALTAIFAIILIEEGVDKNSQIVFVHYMLTAALGIPLFVVIKLLSEKLNFSAANYYFSVVIGFVLLALVYISFPDQDIAVNYFIPYMKYAIYNIAVHLMVAFMPFIKRGEENGFWNYNKALFLRLMEAILYSGVLYLGIAIALGALHGLFDLDIEETVYMNIFVVIVTVFNTWFYAAKLPKDIHTLDSIRVYPKGLKVFSQFILLPLLLVYLLILYSYELKILLSWDWPKGIVSYLVIGISVLGMLTFLLIQPYGNSGENKWIKRFTKSYYLTLIPLVAMLYFAILMRIGDYGFTINRYVILMLGVWLTIVIIYFLIGRTNIKFIPISLTIILVLSSFGPWGMFSVSESSQIGRLENLLSKNGMLENGKIVDEVIWETDSLPTLHEKVESGNQAKVDSSDNEEIFSIVNYLSTFHNYKDMTKYFEQDLEKIVYVRDTSEQHYVNNNSVAYLIYNTMGLDRHKSYRDNRIYLNSENKISYNISGYDKSIEISYATYTNTAQFSPEGMGINKMEFSKDNKSLIVNYEGDDFEFNISKIYSLKHESNVPVQQEDLTFYTEKETAKYKLIINSIHYEKGSKIYTMRGMLLVGGRD
ncbi:MAG: DUF4153 domain-containing protein [Chlorobiota bacterium]